MQLLAWPGVTAGSHRFGGVEFRVQGREIGHLHGDRIADLPFPVAVRDELVASGRAEPHHVLPASRWVTCRIRGAGDVPKVIGLFRMKYDRLAADRPAAGPEKQASSSGGTDTGSAREARSRS